MVPLPCCRGKNPVEHSSAYPACVREEQCGSCSSLQPGNALAKRSTVFTGVEYRVEVARQRFATRIDQCHPVAQTAAKGERCKLAEPNCMGRPRDEPSLRNSMRVSMRGSFQRRRSCVSGRSCTASLCRDGRGAAVAAGLLAQHEGASSRHDSRHDASRGRYFLLNRSCCPRSHTEGDGDEDHPAGMCGCVLAPRRRSE